MGMQSTAVRMVKKEKEPEQPIINCKPNCTAKPSLRSAECCAPGAQQRSETPHSTTKTMAVLSLWKAIGIWWSHHASLVGKDCDW